MARLAVERLFGTNALLGCRQALPLHVCQKHTLDFSKVPKLLEEDLEEDFVRGSGPGGQNINKTSNAVVLRHIPTGIVIKCHQTRSLDKNKQIARELLVQRLDALLNGEESIEAQRKRIQEKKSKESARRSEKLSKLKEEFKHREGVS